MGVSGNDMGWRECDSGMSSGLGGEPVKGRNDVQANAGRLGLRVAVHSRPDALGCGSR
jgi:hypothetical protein